MATKGRELCRTVAGTGCEIVSNGGPACWPTDPKKLADLIGFFVVGNISTDNVKIEEGFDLNSDHSPVYLTIGGGIMERDWSPVLAGKHTDWDYFGYLLESGIGLTVPLRAADRLGES
jgi:hypothetical protein